MSDQVTAERPRIVILSSEFPPGPGGIGTHAHQLALQLHSRQWEVQVLAIQDYVDDDTIAAFNGAQPFAITRLRRLRGTPTQLLPRLVIAGRELLRKRPALLVASGQRMVWLGALLQRLAGVPMVAIGHATEFGVRAAWNRRINRAAFAAADAVVCVSHYTRQQMERMGAAPREVTVIPNGADDSRFHALPPAAGEAFRARHHLGLGPLLVTVGSVHERKGQDAVVRAMPAILRRYPDAHYVSCGLPIRRDAFMALAASLGVAAHVHFLGLVTHEELLEALCAADLFVMASQHLTAGDFEGYGIAAVEAALCGKAAVVTSDSGLAEAIEPGVTGLVARVADPAALAGAVQELLDDRARLARMGAAAQARAQREQTWSQRGEQYDRFLRAVLGRATREADA